MQKKTIKLIRKQHNHYVVKVKQNQPKLYDRIEQACTHSAAIDSFITEEETRGRQDKRVVEVFEIKPMEPEPWKDLRTCIKVTRSGLRPEGAYCRQSFYISDLNLSAKEFAEGIRGHWNIENNLHWQKDVVLKEDSSTIKAGKAPEIFSAFRSFAIAVLVKKDNSLTKAIRLINNKLDKIIELLI